MITTILHNIKKYTITIISILLVIILFGGILFFVYYLTKQNKRIQIIPEFKIIDAQDFNIDSVTQTIQVCKEILARVQSL